MLTAKQVEGLSRELWLVRREIHDYISRLRAFLEQPPIRTDGALERFFAEAAEGSVRVVPPVTLVAAQLETLCDSLASMRHDINGQSSVVLAALELLKLKPGDRARHWGRLTDVPAKMQALMDDFCGKFVNALAPGLLYAPVEGPVAARPNGENLRPEHHLSPGADAMAHLNRSPNAIKELMTKFSTEFEKVLGITHSPGDSLPPMGRAGGF